MSADLLATETKTVLGQPVRLAFRRAREAAPTALFLHGYPDNLQVFARVARALPAEWGFLAADFPGQGKSARSIGAASSTSPSERGKWLIALLDACIVHEVRVFAHDMGAHAALELARQAPKRVQKLVLAHSLLDGDAKMAATLRWLRFAKAYRALLPNLPGTVMRRCLADFLPANDGIPWPIEVDFGQCFDRAVGKHTAAVCDAAEEWLTRGLEPYRALRMPIVQLVGTRNLYFGREHAESLQRVLPHAEIVSVFDGWHWLVWHKPEAVVSALR